MKQNSIFSYGKRNSNNSECMDGNGQCSSNVKEASDPQRTKCTSKVKVRKWDDTHLRYGFLLRNSECSRYIPWMQERPSHYISCFFYFCNNCLFVEVSNNEIFKYLIFLQVIRVYKFLLMGVPWQTRKYIRGSMMTKRLKSTDVGENHHISFEAPFAIRQAGYIVMLFFRCFVCNLWFLFIVRVNVVSCRVTF